MQLFLSQPRYLCGHRLYGSPRAARQGRGLVAAQHQREVAAHAERYARTPVGDRWRLADRPPIEPTY